MEFSYDYATLSTYLQEAGKATVGLSPDLSRPEKVAFTGAIKHPLAFRDAMLVLREVVVTDARQKKKKREAFFEWLTQEVDRRTIEHGDFLGDERNRLSKEMVLLFDNLQQKQKNLKKLRQRYQEISDALKKFNVWGDYDKIYWKFNEFLRTRDPNLYRALDPVISVQPGLVSFEAFSSDESIYGNLSVDFDEFDISGTPVLGTTNIDFSAKLGQAIARFRSYNALELAIKPAGFVVDTGITPRHVEKKIDMPDSWVKGFAQVSSAAGLPGVELDISPADIFALCTFLRRHKARKSPRATIWTLETGKPVRILFQPWNEELILSSIYTGKNNHVEKLWGSRRWLVLERLIPISSKFKLKILGFGMPLFIVAYIGGMTLTLGFSSWSSNDWARGTAFNILAGFVGTATVDAGTVLKRERVMPYDALVRQFPSLNEAQLKVAIGMVLRRGDAYFDIARSKFVYRQLGAVPLPEYLYTPSKQEQEVLKLLSDVDVQPRDVKTNFVMDGESMLHASATFVINRPPLETHLLLNPDGQILKVKCSCSDFQKGERNMSDPCAHLLFLFLKARDHTAIPPVFGLVVENEFAEPQRSQDLLGPRAHEKKAKARHRGRGEDGNDDDDEFNHEDGDNGDGEFEDD